MSGEAGRAIGLHAAQAQAVQPLRGPAADGRRGAARAAGGAGELLEGVAVVGVLAVQGREQGDAEAELVARA
jgi:hypothetical protein